MKPWKRGDPSPNPGGRPKKRPITERYIEWGEAPLPPDMLKELQTLGLPLKKGDTFADAGALLTWLSALEGAKPGQIQAINEIREAIEGKSSQIELSGTEGKDIEIFVTYVKEPEAKDRVLNQAEGAAQAWPPPSGPIA